MLAVLFCSVLFLVVEVSRATWTGFAFCFLVIRTNEQEGGHEVIIYSMSLEKKFGDPMKWQA